MKIGKPDRYVQWPENFGRRFVISVDTEEEFDWSAPFQRSGHTTVSVPMLQKFQEFVEKYHVKPAYFVDYSIITDDAAVAFLRTVAEQQSADIGVHLHPWVNPPFDEQVNVQNSFAGNLPKELEEEKLVALRDAIREKTGTTPTIYRAGRYGIGPHTTALLRKHGFVMDSSIRPRFDYSAEGGPDFLSVGSEPFWWDDDKKLLEVPLTPEGISARETKEAIDVALDDDLQLLVFSFHSPSLSPGHTPYVRTEDALDGFYDWWREVLDHLEMRKVKPVNMDELMTAATAV